MKKICNYWSGSCSLLSISFSSLKPCHISLGIFNYLFVYTHIYIICCLAQKLSPTCCRKVSTKIHTWWFLNPSESGRTLDFFYRFAGFLLPFSCITPNKDCEILPLEKSTPNCPQIKYIADSATLVFFLCSRSLMRQINVLQKLLAMPLEPKPDYILVYFCKDYLVCSP